MTLSLRPRPRGLEINDDPKAEFLAKLSQSLGRGWLQRRRVLSELEHHLEDCVADLRQAGLLEEAAVREAMARLGDVDTIVSAVRATRSTRRLSWRSVTHVAVAWIVVGAMSIVTFAAIELPQAAGAKPTRAQAAPARSCQHDHGPTGGQAAHGSRIPRAIRCS